MSWHLQCVAACLCFGLDLAEQARSGDSRAILLSSHILAEAEALADRVTIIPDGRAVETGTLAEMRHLTRTLAEAELVGSAALDWVAGVHELTVTGSLVRCQVDHAALDEVLGRMHQTGIRSLTCRPPTLGRARGRLRRRHRDRLALRHRDRGPAHGPLSEAAPRAGAGERPAKSKDEKAHSHQVLSPTSATPCGQPWQFPGFLPSAWPAWSPSLRPCNTAEPSGEMSVGDMVVVGEAALIAARAGFVPLPGSFTPVHVHEHGTHPIG
jgi:hypothetical protein